MDAWKKLRRMGWRGVRSALQVRVRHALGFKTALKTPDRRVLEDLILPFIAADSTLHQVLFVGCDWYTAHYNKLLPGCTLVTIDANPSHARYGAKRHIVDRLENLHMHFPENSFDTIVCNGVYGWGLDQLEDCERAFALCISRLREGGLLVFGWNDVPQRDPAPLSAVTSLAALRPLSFPALGTDRYLVSGSADRHTYAFFTRPISTS